MALEALETIHQAEQKIAAEKQQAKAEINDYQAEKDAAFHQAEAQSQALISRLLEEFRTSQTNELQTEKDELLADARQNEQLFQQQYEQNKTDAIEYIVERVKKLYGGH
ncbi:hypothetical protein [Enterococcus canis]|uniref:hypothetical protein n=1 Tax=Enterococcus canis TaxID=214095 RepID=UPI00082F5DAC|nr:hypothetical protein [Enterococcus canis]